MHYRSLVSSACLIGAGFVLCGPAHAADDAAAICNAAISAYGDRRRHWRSRRKMAAVYAPDGEVVSPYGFVAGHDALVKMYASFMKLGDKEVDTSHERAHDRRRGVVHRRLSLSRRRRPHPARRDSWTKVVGKVGGQWKILNLTYAYAAPSVERAAVGLMLS